mmetsp:Transcript_75083/g.220005  ORF Transcript_75083/g.220005 Transcript_75083/m.220005 type:complete len:478 (-) Transcript_75083:63-1496(-)
MQTAWASWKHLRIPYRFLRGLRYLGVLAVLALVGLALVWSRPKARAGREPAIAAPISNDAKTNELLRRSIRSLHCLTMRRYDDPACANLTIAGNKDSFLKNLEADEHQERHSGNASADQVDCVPFTFQVQDKSYMAPELERRGWRRASNKHTAVLLDSVQLAPGPTCATLSGQRVRGKFHYDLALGHKKVIAALNLSWSPRTWMTHSPPWLPCKGPQQEYLLKGDSHSGHGVRKPETFEELREMIGQPCGVGADGQKREFEVIQEIVPPLLVNFRGVDRKIVARVLYVLTRRGRTPSPAEDRWHFQGVAYEAYRYFEAFFNLYPVTVTIQDFAEDQTLRASQPTVDKLLGSPGFISRFLPLADAATSEALQKVTYREGESARNYLEPDGTWQFFAAEFIFREDGRPVLIEFTPDPLIRTVLEGHREVEHIYHGIMRSVPDLLLYVNQLPQSPAQPEPPSEAPADWRFVASREALPHP